MNSVSYILINRPLVYEDKLIIKKLGRPVPDLQITKSRATKTRQFNRYFNKERSYDKFSWMCGCPERNKLFCFVCLLSNTLHLTPWTHQGVDDLQHLQERAIKHMKSTNHLHHLIDYSVLGKANIRKQLDSAYLVGIRAHNENADKNRHILRRLIMCVKFCGGFELALCGHDEGDESQNQNIFRGLVDFTSELDSILSTHLENATVFKGTSKMIQNELLDAMLQVCKKEISNQITKSNYLAIEADEITDSFHQQQLVIIFRYFFEGEIYERFWSFIKPEADTAENIAEVIMQELDHLEVPRDKLIAQSYDGASVMSEKMVGVQALVRKKYRNAFYIHCYAHQFDLILEKAASCNRELRIFFAEIQSFASFFSRSTNATLVLVEIAKRRLPKAVVIRWDFNTRTINTLYENNELIRECLETILDTERDLQTISEVNGLLNSLNSNRFNYFLEVLHYITPHVETFFKQVQSHGVDSVYIQDCLNNFEFQIAEIKQNKINFLELKEEPDIEDPSSKRRRTDSSEINQFVSKEYCDAITAQIRDRFDFTGHLSAAKLFSSDLFPVYKQCFPEQSFENTVETYDFIDKEKLRMELKVIYEREDMRCDGILPLLMFFNKNNMQDGFSETYKLFEIVCTTPMITCEGARRFSTLKRIKCFLRNTVGQDKLNALAMLSTEKRLVQSIADFDNEVINIFAASSERKIDFNYI